MTPLHQHRARRRGLTLMETMVAIAVLLIMSAIVFESLHNSVEFHNLLEARDETIRTARVAMSKLTRDLQLAYLTPNKLAVNSYQTVFVGLDEDPSKLYLASLNHQRLYLDSRECDQTEITVWAEDAPRDRGQGYVLYHREAPRIDEEPAEGGKVWPLAYNVRSFHLRYLDQQNGEWQTSWDTRSATTPYRLPRAVEIGLVLIAPDPADPSGQDTVDVPFLETVLLEYAPRMPNPSQPPVNFSAAGLGGLAGTGFGGLGGGPITNGAFAGMGGSSGGKGGGKGGTTNGTRGGRGGRGGTMGGGFGGPTGGPRGGRR
ncbi:MAG: prepilin-type N-terminal cleavage/methylation domain-containing protein [Alphaproteobacteria bacterium]|nr:prepilin-type N-terminal cleavage/methylation domain-containing protein [Alphaproteobacteria bacterium]